MNTQRPFARLFSVASAVACVVVLVADAHAERRNVLEGQPPVRKRVEMRKSRFEISPQFMFSLNQDFKHFVGGGVVLNYHIADVFGIAAHGAFGGGLNSGLTSNILAVLPDAPTGLQPSKDQFQDHLGTIDYLFDLYAVLTPVSGKLSMFGALFLRYDIYAMLGLGILHMGNTWTRAGSPDPTCQMGDPNVCDPSNSGFKVGGMVGVGVHLFFNQWVGLQLELRDYLASTNPSGLDTNGDRKVSSDDQSFSSNLFVGIGVTLMLPPRAKVSP